jgi:putative nucleotidyltransferase with HDIG domain
MDHLDRIPTMPAILMPLIRQLEAPIEQISVQKIAELVSHDKSLSAQCLHMANSPLFGRWHDIDSVRGAIVALGVSRVRDIAMSCCLMRMVPLHGGSGLDPCAFWEHSLGVALVSRRIARRISFRDPEKAYLAGLLHDLGIVANMLVLQNEFEKVAGYALVRKLPIETAEREVMGLTHCFTGALLAERWRLGADVCEVVWRHHNVEHASLYRGLTALVHLADLICRACGLGYGFAEAETPDYEHSPAWAVLARECPCLDRFDLARFVSEMDIYAAEVKRLVAVLFRVSGG